VRISTRIWGYTLSFVDQDRCKHFLIEVQDGIYRVFGAQARDHRDLNTLIRYHQVTAVSKSGQKLTNAVGEINGNSSMAQFL
jgi:SH2 domain-containing protein 4A